MDLIYEIKQTNSKKGRGLFARTDISEGTIIFSEEPLVSVQFAWNRSCKYLACQYCLKSLESAEEMYCRLAQRDHIELPKSDLGPDQNSNQVVYCPECKDEFCSEECLDKSLKSYHKVLCTKGDTQHPMNQLVETWKSMHYPPETFNVLLVARLIAKFKQLDKEGRKEYLSKLENFCRASSNEEEDISHKLLGANFQNQIEVIRKILQNSLHDENLKQWFTDSGFKSLLCLIGTNGQGIGSSSFSVWVKKLEEQMEKEEENLEEKEMEKMKKKRKKMIDQFYDHMIDVSGDFLDCEGSGLYCLQSSCNHNCEPNSEVTFPYNNHILSLKTTRPIQAGEEITISYLSECERHMSRHSRQKLLRENYLFICNCQLCSSQFDQPDLTSDEEEDEESDDNMED